MRKANGGPRGPPLAFLGRRRRRRRLPRKERRAFAHLPSRAVEAREAVEALIGDTTGSAELTPELFGLAGHEWVQQHALTRQRTRHRRKNVVELRATRRIFRQRPRLRRLNKLVPPRHAVEGAFHTLLEEIAPRSVHRRVILDEIADVRAIERCALTRRHDAVAILLHHRDRPAREIAPAVCELGGIALIEALPGKITVAIERDLAQQEIAERIGAVTVNRLT